MHRNWSMLHGASINSLRKQAKEKISISKWKTWKKISRYRKSSTSQRIFRKAARGAGEDTWKRNHLGPPENGITRKERKRKEKAVVTVEKQEHTLQDETAQHTDNSVWSVASTTIMRHAAEPVPKTKRDRRGPGERESRKQQRLRKQAATQIMITFTFRRQHNTYGEWRKWDHDQIKTLY